MKTAGALSMVVLLLERCCMGFWLPQLHSGNRQSVHGGACETV